MKKSLLLIMLAFTVLAANAQNKKQVWKTYSRAFHGDTITEAGKYLIGKDTTIFEIEKKNCDCAVFQTQTGLMPCDSLVKQHYVEWRYIWAYNIYFFKGKESKRDKPKWEKSCGTGSNLDYEYFYNGRKVWPIKLLKQPLTK